MSRSVVFAFFLAFVASIAAAESVALVVRAEPHPGLDATAPCTVHSVAPGSRDERIDACGEALIFRDSRTKVWVQQGDWITYAAYEAGWLRDEFGREVELSIRPGGRVRLDPSIRHEAEVILYPGLVNGPEFQPALSRFVLPGGDVLMSAVGSENTVALVAGASGKAVAVSRPLSADRGRTITIAPAPPAEGGDLVVRFGSEHSDPDDSYEELALLLTRGGASIQPDYLGREASRGIAVWYGIPAGEGRITLQSDRWTLDPVRVRIRNGEVTDVEAKFLPRPSLTVSVSLARGTLSEAEREQMRVALFTGHVDPDLVREAAVSLEQETVIERLPATAYDVVLRFGGHRVRQRVNLSDGIDGHVSFSLVPIRVSGTVTRGDEPAEARVSFDDAEFATTPEGRYAATLWQPKRYKVRTTIAGLNDDRPLTDSVSIQRDLELDIRVPITKWVVLARDAFTRDPIRGASVSAVNRADRRSGLGRDIVLRSEPMEVGGETDGAGRSPLQPLREGHVLISAHAKGYGSAKTVERVEGESGEERIVELDLTPLPPREVIYLSLPDGQPAAGAEVLARRGSAVFWSGTSEPDGSVVVPERARGTTFIARHDDGGIIARAWGGESVTRWRFPHPAPPLRVRVEREDGTPAADATVIVWIDGMQFDAFSPLPGFSHYADFEGIWSAANLPPERLRIVAIERLSNAGPEELESRATVIPFPWPSEAVVVAIP